MSGDGDGDAQDGDGVDAGGGDGSGRKCDWEKLVGGLQHIQKKAAERTRRLRLATDAAERQATLPPSLALTRG